ncbi:LacI family DNA-binding transcriptional regulator [Mycolicibacterium arseniciresistens]|uniref:LacI family DNA-binding transcriptional regulator n=1 Tax=Mycolicibacterium arseniciresistens TaxID=3062257 RepID=A0ABT8UEM8_9MYCO|nr:LacI family DNA-binding transcriptional regulator [Mycolicibacterium arseniciresistens]MDO3636234.1 LacI family DNA-binding transcriptional regulator [Mycolicibacterium arseniciresistens]
MAVRGAARPTKADVARLAKVSTATVSYVLNNVEGQRISPQTRAAVRDAADRLGYRPNLAARNLAVGGSGVVLYIVPRIALGELPMEVGSRLTTALARHGIVLSLQFETDDDRNVIDAVTDLDPAAVTSVFPLTGAALAAVSARGIPQIHLGSAQLRAMGALHLSIGELRIGHLAERGHRRIAFAHSDIDRLRPLGDYWLEGLRIATRARGMPDLEVATFATDGTGAADQVRTLVDDGVTAVCAQSDETAFVVLHGLRQAGLRCPEDLAVMGVDARPLGAVSGPPLTSVGFDARVIVEVSVAAMMAELGYPTEHDPGIEHVATLIQREST